MDWSFDFITKRKYLIIICITTILRPVNVQLLAPIPGPVPMMALGDPASIKLVASEREDALKGSALAFPVPLPMPMQIGVPAVQPDFCKARKRPPHCPPCPPCLCAPSCTPAFFAYCSPCHLKCRCRDGKLPPVPLPPDPPVPAPGPVYPVPMPMPLHPSVILVPMPPLPPFERPRKYSRYYSPSSSYSRSSSTSDFDSDDSSSSSVSYDFARRSGVKRKKAKKKIEKYNRQKTRRFMQKRKKIIELSKRRNLDVGKENNELSLTDDDTLGIHRLRRKANENKNGNDLVIRPPRDKRITNLSVSFQLSEV